MMATSQNIPTEKTELFVYYYEIPEKAEVRRVPISMLSPSVQKRIMRLAGYMDCSKAPYVIVVSPITIQDLLSDHMERTTKKDHGICLVPVKCSKDIVRTILQMSQTSNKENLSPESELQTFCDSLVPSLQVIMMKASALCMYRNVMYLLPNSNKTNLSQDESEEQEKVERSEATEPQPEVIDSNGEETKNVIVSYSPLQQSDRLEVGATFVNLWNMHLRDLPAETSSTNSSPSSQSSTEDNEQIYFEDHPESQMKGKSSSVGKKETGNIKEKSDSVQDSTATNDDFLFSLWSVALSSPTSSTGSEVSLSSSLPGGKCTYCAGIYIDSLQANISPHRSPTRPGPSTRRAWSPPGTYPCNLRRCGTCSHIMTTDRIRIPNTSFDYKIPKTFTCSTSNVVYLILCAKCPVGGHYIGETKQKLLKRIAYHRHCITNKKTYMPVAQHFCSPDHDITDMKVLILKGHFKNGNYRKIWENYFIITFDTCNSGLNKC